MRIRFCSWPRRREDQRRDAHADLHDQAPSREIAFFLTTFFNRPNTAPDFEAVCRSGKVHIIAPEGIADSDITKIVQAFADEVDDQFSTPYQIAAAREIAHGLPR